MNLLNAANIDQVFVAVVGLGFGGLITVVGFFLKRLVSTQDEHGKTLAKLATTVATHGVKIHALEARR